MCAEQALASWGDLQPLRSKMSQKTQSTALRPNGARAKVPDASRKSKVEDSAGSKVRSVSRDNKASSRRESVKPAIQNVSKRSSSQHESRKAPASQETSKKVPGHRDARSTSRQPEVRKSNLRPDSKAVPSGLDGKATVANSKTSSRPASKNREALTPQVPNAGVKSPSRGSKISAESSGQRLSRSNDKERQLKKVAATSSPGGVSEKWPKTTQRTKTKATEEAPRGSGVAKPSNHAESQATTTVSKKHSAVTRQGTYSKEKFQQAGSKETSRNVEVAMEIKQNDDNAVASTSHSVEKIIPDSSKTETSRTRHSSVVDDNYDDDFEDYESDFENDDDVDDESSPSSAFRDSSSSSSSSSSSDIASASGNNEVPSGKEALQPTSDLLLAKEYSVVNTERNLKSQWKSEPVLEVEAKPPAPLMPTSFSTYSLVSYLTAQRKEQEKKVLSKAQQRAKDVLEMVSLDTMTYQVFDVPPITYDVYISTFGRADAKQVLIQTDLGDEEECQTETIEYDDRWTQQPPHDYKGFGGGKADDTPIDSGTRHLQSGEDMMNLLDFLRNSSDLMLRVMEEDRACETRRNLKRVSEVDGFSDGFLQLDPLRFAKGCPINCVRFSRPCPNYLVTSHDLTSLPEEARASAPGDTVLCVWNLNSPATPTDVLVSNCRLTCCQWSPS
ncbi:hypothetical protein MRX96_009644 [Rhipicephalus microplus]